MAQPVIFRKKDTVSLPSSVDQDTFYIQLRQQNDTDGIPLNKGSIYVGQTLVSKGVENIQDGSFDNGSISIGQDNSNSGNNTTAIGSNLSANNSDELVVGSNNISIDDVSVQFANQNRNLLNIQKDGSLVQSKDLYSNCNNVKKNKILFDKNTIIYDEANQVWKLNTTGAQPGQVMIWNGTSIEWKTL